MALSIVMLHSMVPHHHHQDSESAQIYFDCVDIDSPIDFLSFVFHTDIGSENHFEEFNLASNLQLVQDFVLPPFFKLEIPLDIERNTPQNTIANSKIDQEYYLSSSIAKRGPPLS